MMVWRVASPRRVHLIGPTQGCTWMRTSLHEPKLDRVAQCERWQEFQCLEVTILKDLGQSWQNVYTAYGMNMVNDIFACLVRHN